MSLNLKFVVSVLSFLLFVSSTTVNSQLLIPESGLPKHWEKCVVMIEKELRNANGRIDTVAHGTGFLYYDNTLQTVLITNKHLLLGRDLIFLRFNKANFDPNKDTVRYHREPYALVGKDSKLLWKGHPNPNVDVAALQISLPARVDVRWIDQSRLKNFDSLQVGEDVYFFGFPLGVAGLKGKGDFPVLRSGVVSYKALELTRIGDQIIDSAMFLIDGFSFGGNSGSPVLSKATLQAPYSKLIGIINAHVPLRDSIVVCADSFFVLHKGDTLFIKPHPDTIVLEQNTGLAIAICADRIRETLEQFRTNELSPEKK